MKRDRACKRCGMPIKFARSEGGKNVPVSIESAEKRIVLDGRGGCRVVDTYLSHFADCPQADAFRRPS